jgi:NADH-quinone oxidoreductase subunit K
MLLAALLFLVGLTGLLLRRDIVFMLMCVEIMLNAAGLAFIVAGSAWGKADGQIMFLFILTMAAAEVAVGLALIIQMFAKFKSVDTNSTNTMKG